MATKRDIGRLSEVARLFDAAARGAIDEVRALTLEGVSGDCRDDYGNSPVMLSVSRPHGFLPALFLIRAGASVNGTNLLGETPLLNASWAGNIAAVKLLLRNGADPNVASRSGYTPLMAAVDCGHEKIVRVLLIHGADADAMNRSGVTTIMRAIDRGYDDIAVMLADYGAKSGGGRATR